MTRIRIHIFALLALLISFTALAQQSEQFEPPADPKRYWIIVDKTAAARSFSGAIRQTVFDLVYRGGDGEMADGSVIEIWIYGDDTSVRGFAPEMLMPDNHLEIAQKASNYIRKFPEQGLGDMPEFAEHIRDMASIVFETTIFLVSAPTTRLEGTLVDDEVNAIFDVHGERMTRELKPFITTFRIQDGKLASHSVSESALALAVPPMPVSKVSNAEKLRMIAESRDAIDAKETARLEAIAAETKARMEAEEEAKRLARIEREKPDDEREGAIILRGTPPKENVTQSETLEVAGSDPVPEIKENETAPAENVVVPETAEPIEDRIAETEESSAASEETAIEVVDVPADTSEAPIEPSSTETATENTRNPDVVDNGGDADSSSTNVLAESEIGLEMASTNAAAASANPEMDPKNFAVQPQTWFTAGGLFAVGLLFFVVAGALVWVAIRRTKSASGPSYITQSMQSKRIDRS